MSSFAQINAFLSATERKQADDANTIGELNVELLWARAEADGLYTQVKMLREMLAASAAPAVQLCLADKKRAYQLKNRVACACGGKSSKIDSTKKIHEAGKQHVDYIQQQAAVAAAVAAASVPSSEDAKLVRKNELRRERNRSMVKACPCGGKTAAPRAVHKKHEASQMHQAWVEENEQYSDANE